MFIWSSLPSHGRGRRFKSSPAYQRNQEVRPCDSMAFSFWMPHSCHKVTFFSGAHFLTPCNTDLRFSMIEGHPVNGLLKLVVADSTVSLVNAQTKLRMPHDGLLDLRVHL
jgi:hypothetical protein